MVNWKQTKEEEFNEFFENNRHYVYRIAMGFMKNPDIAEDIAQKAFFNLYRFYDRIAPLGRRMYVIRAATNISLNWYRDTRKFREGEIVELTEEVPAINDVENYYLREEEKLAALTLSHSILSRLYVKNKGWYHAIMEVFYFDRNVIEVAEEEGVTPEVISSRIYRAKKWIHKEYQKEYEEYLKLKEGM